MASPTPPASIAAPMPIATRIRWGNLAIAVAIAAAAVGIATWFVLDGRAASSATPASAQPGSAPGTIVAGMADGEMSAAAATDLVAEATSLMGEGRWEEAADRLASIPAEHRDASGADAVAATLEQRRTRHQELRATLDAQLEARQWRRADATLDELEALVPLDDQLVAVRTDVRGNLTTGAGSSARTETDASETHATAPGSSDATETARRPKPKPSVTTPSAAPASDLDGLLAQLDASGSLDVDGLLAEAGIDATKLEALQQSFDEALTPAELERLTAALRDALGDEQLAALEAVLQGA